MPQNRVDLANLFSAVTQNLAQNQQTLDQADEYNHDHGTNMVKTFETITEALEEKRGKSDRTALAYAAKKLAKSTNSGSGQLYGQSLAKASKQVKGKNMDTRGAMQLLQTLIGGGEQSQGSSGDDLLGALLGGMTGGSQSQPTQAPADDDLLGALLGGMAGGTQPQPTQASAGDDLLGALLGGMAGGSQSQPTQASAGDDLLGALMGGMTGSGSSGGAKDGLDLGDLLNAGMSFLQAKQSGGSTAEALIHAFVNASGMGSSAHRTQSTTMVVDSFLHALGGQSSSR